MQNTCCYCCSVAKSCQTLRPHGLQHARPLCPPLFPGVQFMSTESMMPSKPLILCHPLLLLPSIFPSIRVFSNVSCNKCTVSVAYCYYLEEMEGRKRGINKILLMLTVTLKSQSCILSQCRKDTFLSRQATFPLHNPSVLVPERPLTEIS